MIHKKVSEPKSGVSESVFWKVLHWKDNVPVPNNLEEDIFLDFSIFQEVMAKDHSTVLSGTIESDHDDLTIMETL